MPENNTQPVTEIQIGNTTYIIEATNNPGATETLYEKIKRLILEDASSLNHS
jgi:hypothetical protein